MARPPTWILAPRSCAAIALLAAASGCAYPSYDQSDDSFWNNDPAAILESYRAAIDDTGPNALIGVEKMLSASLIRNDWKNAESLAIRASTLVNIFTADEPGERDAISFFGQEKDKPFKGEPQERVMVDYYLGILRFGNRDYEGALAAFRSAMNKDRGTFLIPVEVEEAKKDAENADRFLYEDDWVTLHFLAAKCCQLLEEPEDSQKFLARACEIRPQLKPLFQLGMDSSTNAIVLIEGGRAPFKRRTGPQGAVLAYARGPETSVERVSLNGRDLTFALCEDLYYQATTVGGRQVDQINVVKAERQQVLQAAGFFTLQAGYAIALAGAINNNRNVQAAGLIALGVGIASLIFASAAIDPSADIRAWTTLPGHIYLAVGAAPPGEHAKLVVRARGDGDLSQEWSDAPIEEGLNLYWIRLLPDRRGGAWMPPVEGPKTENAAPEEPPQERST